MKTILNYKVLFFNIYRVDRFYLLVFILQVQLLLSLYITKKGSQRHLILLCAVFRISYHPRLLALCPDTRNIYYTE